MPRFFEMRSKEAEKIFLVELNCDEVFASLTQFGNMSNLAQDSVLHECGKLNSRYVHFYLLGLYFCPVQNDSICYSQLNYGKVKTLKRLKVIELEPTWLGENKNYQFVYATILNTVFATAAPVFLLFYLNISTVTGKLSF